MERRFENHKYIVEYFPERKTVEFYMKDQEIEKEDIAAMHAVTLAMTSTAHYATLFSAMDFFSITAEARAEGQKRHYSAFVTVQAFVVKNLAQRLIGNFIMKFNTPVRESKLFSNYADAKAWLEVKIPEFEATEKAKLKKMKA